MDNSLRRMARLRPSQTAQAAESHYLGLFDGIPVGLYRSTPAGRFLDVNLTLVRMLKYPDRDTLLAIDVVDLYETSETRVRWQELMDREGIVRDFEIRFRRYDDTIIWLRESSRTVRDKNDQILYYEGALEDITERKQAEESLRQTERLNQAVIEHSPVGISVRSQTGELLFTNAAWKRIWSLSDREIREAEQKSVGVSFAERYPYLGDAVRDVEQVFESGGDLFIPEIECQTSRTNVARWVSQYLYALRDEHGQVEKVVTLTQDITARKRAEAEVRRLQEFSEGIVQSMVEGIAVQDTEGAFTFVNPAAAALLGYDPQELLGQHWTSVVPPDQQSIIQMADERRRRGESDQYEVALSCRDGRRTPVLISGSPRFQGDRFIGTLAVFTDITERKQAEMALQKSEEKYRSILESIQDGYFEVDLAGNFTFFNDAMCRIVGYTRSEMMGMNNRQYMDRENAEKVFKVFNRVYTTGEPAQGFDWVLVDKDGGRKFVEVSVSLIRDSHGESVGFRGVARDITKRKQVEEALRHYADRLRLQHETDRAILAARSSEEIVLAALERIRRLVPCQRTSVTAFDFENQETTVLAAIASGDTRVGTGVRRPLEDFGLPEELWRGESWILEDILDSSRTSSMARTLQQEGIRAFLRVPLRVQNELIGTLNLGSVRPGAFTAEHADIAGEIADSLAVAIQNARLFQAEREQRELAETLREVVGALSTTLDREQVLQLILEQLARVVDYDSASVLLVTDETPDFAAHWGIRSGAQLLNPSQISALPHVRQVLEDRVSAIISDTATDPRWLPWPGSEYIRSWLGVPLVAQDQVLGLLNLDKEEPNFYTEHHVAIAQTFADQSAIAIANARLYEATRARSRYLETLQQINATLRSTLPLAEVLKTIARGAGQVLGYVGTIIVVPNAGRERLHLGAAWGKRFLDTASYFTDLPGGPFSLSLTDDENPMALAYRTGELQAWSRAPERIVRGVEPAISTRLAPLIEQATGTQLTVCVPLPAGQTIVGVLAAFSPREQLPDEERTMLLGLAAQAGMAIENARLYEDLQNQMEELKQTQAQLVQSAKMAAIGQLAAGVAHELNNPLTSVLGFAELLLRSVTPDDPNQTRLAIIASEARRARDIVRGLLDFARQTEFRRQPADVNRIVQETLALIRQRLEKGGVTLEEHYAPDLLPLLLDTSRIKQVILNLAINALHAMPHGGTLSVTSEQVGDGVAIRFVDTGMGIAGKHLPRIFEPFFTTKSVGEGAGLGLSISLGIVQDHGGNIEVESQEGKGSTFTIWLPAICRENQNP